MTAYTIMMAKIPAAKTAPYFPAPRPQPSTPPPRFARRYKPIYFSTDLNLLMGHLTFSGLRGANCSVKPLSSTWFTRRSHTDDGCRRAVKLTIFDRAGHVEGGTGTAPGATT